MVVLKRFFTLWSVVSGHCLAFWFTMPRFLVMVQLNTASASLIWHVGSWVGMIFWMMNEWPIDFQWLLKVWSEILKNKHWSCESNMVKVWYHGTKWGSFGRKAIYTGGYISAVTTNVKIFDFEKKDLLTGQESHGQLWAHPSSFWF